MLKIRLKRVGRRNDPSFRVVVVDSHQGPKSSKAIEIVGSYNPQKKEKSIKGDRVKYWMSVGAQPSDTVYNILVDEKVIGGAKKNVLPKKSPVAAEVVEEEATAATEEKAPESAEGGNKEAGVESEEPKKEQTEEKTVDKEEGGKPQKKEAADDSKDAPVSAEKPVKE